MKFRCNFARFCETKSLCQRLSLWESWRAAPERARTAKAHLPTLRYDGSIKKGAYRCALASLSAGLPSPSLLRNATSPRVRGKGSTVTFLALLLGWLSSECETEGFCQQKLRADVKWREFSFKFNLSPLHPAQRGHVAELSYKGEPNIGDHFLSRLSLLVAHRVPTVWNSCTSSTSRMTQTIMMLVW